MTALPSNLSAALQSALAVVSASALPQSILTVLYNMVSEPGVFGGAIFGPGEGSSGFPRALPR
jgi:hypothetical protein